MARLTKRTLGERHLQQRGWGHERWIENLPEYCGKILIVDPGKKGSLHFHRKKKETMLVLDGKMVLRLIDTDTAQEYFLQLDEGDNVLIEPGQPHQIINVGTTLLTIVEFSTTHEEDDSRRLQKGD